MKQATVIPFLAAIFQLSGAMLPSHGKLCISRVYKDGSVRYNDIPFYRENRKGEVVFDIENTTVKELKKKIQHHRLSFFPSLTSVYKEKNGKDPLEDAKKLSECGIKFEDELFIKVDGTSHEGKIILADKKSKRPSFNVPYDEDVTLFSLSLYGPNDSGEIDFIDFRIKFFYRGEELDSKKTLQEYGIKQGSTILYSRHDAWYRTRPSYDEPPSRLVQILAATFLLASFLPSIWLIFTIFRSEEKLGVERIKSEEG